MKITTITQFKVIQGLSVSPILARIESLSSVIDRHTDGHDMRTPCLPTGPYIFFNEFIRLTEKVVFVVELTRLPVCLASRHCRHQTRASVGARVQRTNKSTYSSSWFVHAMSNSRTSRDSASLRLRFKQAFPVLRHGHSTLYTRRTFP